ncbi:MAG: hypothetical protein SNJ77_04545 [Cytophagales bacterium]
MHQILTLLIVLWSLFFISCKSSSKTQLNLNEAIVGIWYHSFEEDSADVKCFRKDGFKFPEARGRMGMVFNEKGAFEQINIGATDKEERVKGSWRIAHNNMIDIHLFQHKKFVYKAKVFEVTKNKLRWQIVPHH